MHWLGLCFYVCIGLAPVYLVWRVRWTPERSSKSGWQLIIAMGVLWALAFSPGLLYARTWAFLAGGLVCVALLGLELWSRGRPHQRLDGVPALQGQLLWRLVLFLGLVAVWIWVGDHISELNRRYEAELLPGPPFSTFVADYSVKVVWALVVGVVTSVLVYGVLGLVRNVVGLVRK